MEELTASSRPILLKTALADHSRLEPHETTFRITSYSTIATSGMVKPPLKLGKKAKLGVFRQNRPKGDARDSEQRPFEVMATQPQRECPAKAQVLAKT